MGARKHLEASLSELAARLPPALGLFVEVLFLSGQQDLCSCLASTLCGCGLPGCTVEGGNDIGCIRRQVGFDVLLIAGRQFSFGGSGPPGCTAEGGNELGHMSQQKGNDMLCCSGWQVLLEWAAWMRLWREATSLAE